MNSVTVNSTIAPASTRILLLVGPPGCGKGTQAERLSRHCGIPAISTGDMIRAEIKAGTELGRVAAGITITGGLLSDEIVNKIVRSRLSHPDCANGFLLDGYPRTVEQAKFLRALLEELQVSPPTVVHIDVPEPLLIARTCNRRHCGKCGSIYNVTSHPPKVPGFCDTCHIELQLRADDCEDTVHNRLLAYEKSTVPLLDYFRQGPYVHIDGTSTPDSVFAAICNSLV